MAGSKNISSEEYRALVLRQMSEREWQRRVIQLFLVNGWMTFHIHGRAAKGQEWGTHSGFPDLVMVHPHRGIVFAELKTMSGRVSPSQKAWIKALRLISINAPWFRADVYRPDRYDEMKEIAGGAQPL